MIKQQHRVLWNYEVCLNVNYDGNTNGTTKLISNIEITYGEDI